MKKITKINLRLFDEGGSEGGGEVSASTEQTEGVTEQVANAQEQATTKPSFDELLADADYKKAYDAKMQAIVKDRLKGAKENEARLSKINPILENLAKRYGADANNLEDLMTKLEADSKQLEDEALKKGVTPEQLLESRRIERARAELDAQIKEQETERARAEFNAKLEAQVNEAKALFPEMDFAVEVANEDFAKLLRAGIDVKTAYNVIHRDDIAIGLAKRVSQETAQKISNSIQSGQSRPIENAAGSSAGITTKFDVSNLTPSQIAKTDKWIARGNKVDFSNPSAEFLSYLKG